MATNTHSMRMSMAVSRSDVRHPVALLAAAIVGLCIDDARHGESVQLESEVLDWGDIDPQLLEGTGVEIVA